MNSFIGGIIIGLAAFLLFLTIGRVMGISGIFGNLLKIENYKNNSKDNNKDNKWRISFIAGLLVGGILLKVFRPESFYLISLSYFHYIIAGLLVGFGTLLGSGCTSGHGVCGISRFSVRSISATVIFIFFGILGVFVSRLLQGVIS